MSDIQLLAIGLFSGALFAICYWIGYERGYSDAGA